MITSKIEIQNILPNTNSTCFVIQSLFSKIECEELLNTKIKNSFKKAISNYPTYYRNNDRFVTDNDDLANQLFEKVKPYLPETIKINSTIQSENGVWHLKELNNRLRYCKYSTNQYFHRHLDGVHYRDETTQSKLTFMIYLNSATEFKGGRTLFFKTKETDEIWASYVPKQGDLIVFDHNVWHEGEILTQGEKFVLRSDILYSKEAIKQIQEPFTGHLGYIWSILKIDDNTILSGGRDKEIKSWNISGKQKYSFKGHQNSILCIEKISDDIFVSGSRDRQILVWKDHKVFNKIKVHAAIVLSLCRLDNNTLASSSGDNTIKLSNLNGTVLKTFKEHTNWVWQVIKLDHDIISSSSEDGTIKIWNLNTDKSLKTFLEDCSIISLSYNRLTRKLISGNLRGEISIRTLSKDYHQTKIQTFKAHVGIIRTIKVINNNQFATGGEDNKVKIWDFDGKLIVEFEHQNFVQSIEKLDDNTIISASYDGTIKTWKIKTTANNGYIA
ncbi:MAG: 2OG-Fe(II) oxygenase [Winogradskyella sp.]|uniref:2OG-Fe(II) oxygenase n=1 Tax=Winogradskyella sp. TaxID=1883156 RepID=UPI0025FBCDAB|nr:2OG-Fe(II) oxygenase [Winogradskyella sp.]NRB84838.1 2OG-Fe(II) oxygenase [Winogradskyella sp.]